MATKHTVTDSRGQVHKRTSKDRVYAFAVVHHVPARPAREHYLAIAAYSHAEWASNERNAQNTANRWRRMGIEVEIIPAVVS